jgi:GNAT superfamily N-acetyltransferase
MPDAQGRGVGLKLFQTVVDHVCDWLSESDTAGIPPASSTERQSRKARIELNVNKFNSAVNFYKHLGMRVLLEEDFPIGNGFYKTDYIMGLDI